jgi:hypothetical protein
MGDDARDPGRADGDGVTELAIVLEARHVALQFAFAMAADVDITLDQTLLYAERLERWLIRDLGLSRH